MSPYVMKRCIRVERANSGIAWPEVVVRNVDTA